MCGITGFTHSHSRPARDRIEDSTLSLVHRGPDQQGVHESAAVSLGAVRLKIIDLDGGVQPMRSDDGDTVLVFNGEIYNHAELRRQLESLGHRFRSRSDTEVVLRAFLEWDKAAFTRLRGMFALALWTESERRLVLARDRMGIKPLYIHQRGRELYFASELKALFEHPEVDRRIDLDGLNLYLSLNYVPGPFTLVHGIRKLPPGHWLEWRAGRLSTGAYWRLEFRPGQRLRLNDTVEELDWLLRDVVREHLVSDVPLGVWSSGGIDSSTVLHYAAEACPSRLKTFSVSFLGNRFDESPFFRLVARRYGTEHHEFDLNPESDLVEALEKIAYYSDEPSADAGALPVYYLSLMTRKHVTVALSGEGADELFGGYTTYLADRCARLARLAPRLLRRWALQRLAAWPVSDEKIGLEYKLKRFLAGSLLPPDQAHLFWNGTFSEEEKRGLLQASGRAALEQLYDALPAAALQTGAVNRYLWLDQLYYLPDDILYKCDRMSMAHSLEVRPPFLDHRVVELAASLPESWKVRGASLKFLLRRLMRGKLPQPVLTRKKEGFDIPAHRWLRGVLKPLLVETLSPQAVERTGLFRADAVQDLIRAHLERRANLGYHLWGLLTLFLWMNSWRIQPAPEASRDEFAQVTG